MILPRDYFIYLLEHADGRAVDPFLNEDNYRFYHPKAVDLKRTSASNPPIHIDPSLHPSQKQMRLLQILYALEQSSQQGFPVSKQMSGDSFAQESVDVKHRAGSLQQDSAAAKQESSNSVQIGSFAEHSKASLQQDSPLNSQYVLSIREDPKLPIFSPVTTQNKRIKRHPIPPKSSEVPHLLSPRSPHSEVWTAELDNQLIKLRKLIPFNWKQIAECLDRVIIKE